VLVLHCKLNLSSSRQVPGYRPKKGKPCREGYIIAWDLDVKYGGSYKLHLVKGNNYYWLYYQLGERYIASAGNIFALNQTWKYVLLILNRVHSGILQLPSLNDTEPACSKSSIAGVHYLVCSSTTYLFSLITLQCIQIKVQYSVPSLFSFECINRRIRAEEVRINPNVWGGLAIGCRTVRYDLKWILEYIIVCTNLIVKTTDLFKVCRKIGRENTQLFVTSLTPNKTMLCSIWC
jgi:hypothetical protein